MMAMDRLLWPTDGAMLGPFPELAGTGATVRQVRAAAGFRGERHSHPFEQFLYVVAGAGIIERESGPITVAPGVVIHFAPNDWHRAEFTADTLLVEMNLRDMPTAGV